MPEDIAITSSKSDIDPCSHDRDRPLKSADGQTDGSSALYSRYMYKKIYIYIKQAAV